MKILILFSMVCLMPTVIQAQNETPAVANDSVGGNVWEGEKQSWERLHLQLKQGESQTPKAVSE